MRENHHARLDLSCRASIGTPLFLHLSFLLRFHTNLGRICDLIPAEFSYSLVGSGVTGLIPDVTKDFGKSTIVWLTELGCLAADRLSHQLPIVVVGDLFRLLLARHSDRPLISDIAIIGQAHLALILQKRLNLSFQMIADVNDVSGGGQRMLGKVVALRDKTRLYS
jgi:hypothetical protein